MDKDLDYLLKTLLLEKYGDLPENSLDIYLMDNGITCAVLIDLCIACGIIPDEQSNEEE